MLTNGRPAPAWVDDLQGKYSSGVAHAFVLHFNVRDYVDRPGQGLRSYLGALFASSEIVAFYDRAQGITFPLPAMRAAFVEAAGLAQSQGDDLTALLSQVNGGRAAGGETPLPADPSSALPLLERVLRAPAGEGKARKLALVVDYAETICPAADKAMMSPADRTALVTVCRWGADPEIAATGNIIVLVTNNLAELHPDVRAASAKYETVRLPLPDYEARQAFCEDMQVAHMEVESDLGLSQMAAMTAGLSRVHIEDIYLRASIEGSLTAEMVRERKADIIASEYAEVIEIIEPRAGFEIIGGLEHVKTFFRKSVIEPMASDNRKRVPMGVLMTGPAGTGKTVMAEALAKEAGVNCVALNIQKLLGGIVGTSERNLEKAIACIETLAPTIVFVDEVDQRVRRGEGGASDGGSSVNNNIFSRLLEFMSDGSHRGRIVFLAATNRPDLLDAAFKRPGRFDRKIPFLVPNAEERSQIVAAMVRKYAIPYAPDGALLVRVVERTEGWTGAELEMLVLKAWELAQDDGREEVRDWDLAAAREVLSPSTADIELMSALAIRECNDLSLLPEQYRAQLKDRAALEQKIETLGPRGKRSL